MNQIKTVVQSRQGRMPGFSQLNPRALDALVAYLVSPLINPPANFASEPSPHWTPLRFFDSLAPQRYWSRVDFMLTSTRLSAIGPPLSQLTA